MVAYFHEQGLDGMAHWMRCQAHEEMIHAMKFLTILLTGVVRHTAGFKADQNNMEETTGGLAGCL